MEFVSKPKYLRSDASPASVVVTIEVLMKYIFTITNNEKQFPKSYRYTLVTDIRNTCLKMHKSAYNALSVKPRYLEQYKKRIKYQQKVYRRLIDLKALLVIATSVVHIQNLEHLSILMNNTFEAYNRWVKNDSRMYKNLLPKDEYFERRDENNRRRKEYLSMERDADGFIILKKKGCC